MMMIKDLLGRLGSRGQLSPIPCWCEPQSGHLARQRPSYTASLWSAPTGRRNGGGGSKWEPDTFADPGELSMVLIWPFSPLGLGGGWGQYVVMAQEFPLLTIGTGAGGMGESV